MTMFVFCQSNDKGMVLGQRLYVHVRQTCMYQPQTKAVTL